MHLHRRHRHDDDDKGRCRKSEIHCPAHACSKQNKCDDEHLGPPRERHFPAPAVCVPPSGFGLLSPICRTLPSSSDICMPLSASNSAGTCAAILVMSPVTLFMPAESPLPVETMVILSTFCSGEASALTTSGRLVKSLSTTAA